MRTLWNKLVRVVWFAVMAVLLLALSREAWVVTVDHVLIPDWRDFSWRMWMLDWAHLPANVNLLRRFNAGLYWWFGVGVVLYPLLRWLTVRCSLAQKHSFTDMETLSHEMSHWLMGKLLGRQMHSFHAEKDSGVVMSSGSRWSQTIMALAPYTFPYMTYFMLALRSIIIPQRAWLFDILMGLTFGFHLVCFFTQTSKRQTDINHFSTLWIPGIYIATWGLFNYCVIAVSFWTGSHQNFFRAIWWVVSHLFAPHIP